MDLVVHAAQRSDDRSRTLISRRINNAVLYWQGEDLSSLVCDRPARANGVLELNIACDLDVAGVTSHKQLCIVNGTRALDQLDCQVHSTQPSRQPDQQRSD